MKHETTFAPATDNPVINALVQIRLAWGLERSEVAARCGIDARKLRLYEIGQSEPHSRYLRRWANVLGYELTLRPMESCQ